MIVMVEKTNNLNSGINASIIKFLMLIIFYLTFSSKPNKHKILNESVSKI